MIFKTIVAMAMILKIDAITFKALDFHRTKGAQLQSFEKLLINFTTLE